ncbi:unnamed protein product [Adineta ricciae]|uniref:Uncharacterized protein n=1 Tax=Adineta ricciae TaxID=249248 RepID=A0A814FKS8_ADIRI|nr:unnamed protein product [Adineta ricciae]
MNNPTISNSHQSLRSFHTKENDIVRLFDELLPWTFNCRTLIDAARNGETAECEDLIRLGVDINDSDTYGNTAVWTSYFHEHLDTLFTLLQLGADPNTRSGEILCSDLHRACSLGDRTLTEILIECGGYVNISDRNGKTPLIYALEYPSSKYTLDLISYLIEHGADVNHRDEHGLTPLHYACYRADYQSMKLLVEHQADISIENSIGYNILRYALSCLSYTSPFEHAQYTNRLCIVDLLVNQYSIGSYLSHAIIGKSHSHVHLFPLFDFLSYSLIRQRTDLEDFAWNIFLNLHLTKQLTCTLESSIQHTFIYSHYFSHVIYLSQRFHITNYLLFFSNYLERVTVDAEPNRFCVLLYTIHVDHGLTLVQSMSEHLNVPLDYSRRCILEKLISKSLEKPEQLKFYCRRSIRKSLSMGIHCKLKGICLNKHLKDYILLRELDFFIFK